MGGKGEQFISAQNEVEQNRTLVMFASLQPLLVPMFP